MFVRCDQIKAKKFALDFGGATAAPAAAKKAPTPKKSPKKKRAKINFDDMDDEEFEAMILAKRKAKRAKKAEKN